ncbi:tRNA pseudouridine(38-40) synthase TruA [bacterium]|nr:tRNA pseudouridine(38-40) synthase TruA [bacterium]
MYQKKTGLQRYAIWLEYDGAAFAGFQFQKKKVTVQSTLERAITFRFHETCRVAVASRTDAGVHAKAQVAIFDMAYAIAAEKLGPALNSALPVSVKVLSAKKVAPDWEPRKQSIQKIYAYLIYERPIVSPLQHQRMWQVMQRLDLAAMRSAVRHLIGKHDFSSFRASGCASKHATRDLEKISITRKGYVLTLRFFGNAFLYHMVRNLVGTLVEVGKGRLKPGEVKIILQTRNRKKAGPTAPACGLYLEKIKFKN